MPRIFKETGAVSTVVVDEWVRPSDWLSMPTLVDGDQKIEILCAVWDNTSNFVAFTIDGGGYTVDIGDGGGPVNVADGVKFEANLAWDDYNASTLTSRGYRQAIISIGAQAAQTLTYANMVATHTDTYESESTSYLDMLCAGSGFTKIQLYATNGNAASRLIERFRFIGVCNIDDMNLSFKDTFSLKVFEISDSSNVTTYSRMFEDSGIEVQPTLDFSSATNVNDMYENAGLKEITFDLTGLAATEIIRDCKRITKATLSNTGSMTSLSNFARSCTMLREFTMDDCSSVTVAATTFSASQALSKIILTGMTVTFTINDCNLNTTEIDALFTSLGDGTGETVTVTNNPGSATCDPTIATAKNWTVVTA